MLKEQKNNIFVLAIVAIMGILLATTTPAAALDIGAIYMTSCKDHLDGTPETTPWVFEVWFDFEAEGGLDHIEVTTPGGSGPFTIDEYGGWDPWSYFSPTDYSSLDALRGDYPTGEYKFDFFDGATLLDSVTLTYPALSEPGDFVHFTSPTHGATDVPLDPTFEWTVASGAGDALGMWVWDEVMEEDKYWNAPVPMDTLSWEPGVLDPDHEYDLEVSVFRVKDGRLVNGHPTLPTMMTDGEDLFAYGLMTEYINEVGFTTVPEPATIALLGLGCLVLIRRRRK